ncbi:MAG: hypothetical protein AAB557_04325 [Patescibacteria group bacterium]
MHVDDLKKKLIDGSLGGRQEQAGPHGLANAFTGLMLGVASCEFLPEKKAELLNQYGFASLQELKDAMATLKEELRSELTPEAFNGYFREGTGSKEG